MFDVQKKTAPAQKLPGAVKKGFCLFQRAAGFAPIISQKKGFRSVAATGDADLLPDEKTGWTLPTFQNLPLGWVKILPGRVNNYLPQARRIRMALK